MNIYLTKLVSFLYDDGKRFPWLIDVSNTRIIATRCQPYPRSNPGALVLEYYLAVNYII